MKIFNVVIFDFDGVIYDSWQNNYKIIKFLSKFSKYNEEDIKKMWGIDGMVLVKILTEDFPWIFKKIIPKLIYWFWRIKEIRNNSKANFFKDTIETIEKMKQIPNCEIGILTNRRAETLKPLLKKLPKSPEHYFDFIQTLEKNEKNFSKNIIFKNHFSSCWPKPKYAAFTNIVHKYIRHKLNHKLINKEVNDYEIFYIGDTLIDLQFAQTANIKFFGVLNGPLDSKEKWIQWSNGQINEENILTSISELLNKLKIPQ